MVRSMPWAKAPRCILRPEDACFPETLRSIPKPPKQLYVVGNARALAEGLAIVGARKATPYGIACARRFATIAAELGISVISGGARGCDSEAHVAALDVGATTVAVLGGGCDRPYPAEHEGLFADIVRSGGALVSEYPWDHDPRPWGFRARNRLIAGLARATLIVEAGLPSGTFSTADEALHASREVLVVPGAITSPSSAGANRLLAQGAIPIVDDETFRDAMLLLFGSLSCERTDALDADERLALKLQAFPELDEELVRALLAQPMGLDELLPQAIELRGRDGARTWLMMQMAKAEQSGIVSRYPDGRYGAALIP